MDRPEVTLHAEIAVGAAISLGFASAGAEGGISATILFNFADLDGDGKIRFDELKSNVLANGGNEISRFRVTGTRAWRRVLDTAAPPPLDFSPTGRAARVARKDVHTLEPRSLVLLAR